MKIQLLGSEVSQQDQTIIPAISAGCRAIIEQDNCILFSCLTKRSQYLLPGGRIDLGESLQACVVRECLEELGMVVEVNRWLCSIEEKYGNGWFRNEYFVVDVKAQDLPLQLVKEEIALKLAPVWVPKDKVIQKLLQTPIDERWWEASNNLAIKHSHYREACALSVYFSTNLPMIPVYFEGSLSKVDVCTD